MSALKTEPAKTEKRFEDNETHLVCDCNPDKALCGRYVGDRPWTDDEATCVVCADLEDTFCASCGE